MSFLCRRRHQAPQGRTRRRRMAGRDGGYCWRGIKSRMLSCGKGLAPSICQGTQGKVRPRVQRASGVPDALFGRKIHQSLGRFASRGREVASVIGVPSLRAKRSNPDSVITQSFRGDAKHRARNLEIPGLVLRTIPE